MVVGTTLDASYIWALFYLLALKMIEILTLGIINGNSFTSEPSSCAITVLGDALSSIPEFGNKFTHCLMLSLTQFLISTGDEDPELDTWDFSADEAQITSKKNPYCRWLWAGLSRLVSYISIDVCVIENIPALSGRGVHPPFLL